MKRIVLASALALAFAVAPAAAQTEVSVALGFGPPRPYVSGVVVVGRPYAYYPAPEVIVVRPPRRYFYCPRPFFSRRPGREGWRGYEPRYHRHRHFGYDGDEE